PPRARLRVRRLPAASRPPRESPPECGRHHPFTRSPVHPVSQPSPARGWQPIQRMSLAMDPRGGAAGEAARKARFESLVAALLVPAAHGLALRALEEEFSA